MTVHRTLPARETSLVGAWCFADHFGPDDVSVTGGMGVARHPHTGLATVSWLFEGAITHRDSLGNHAIVEPGDLDLMVAGYGITHSEYSTRDATILHGVQLWYALPGRARFRDRDFLKYTAGASAADGARLRVGLGAVRAKTAPDGEAQPRLLTGSSPVETDTGLLLAQVDLKPGCELHIDLREDWEYAVLVDLGSAEMTAQVTGPEARTEQGQGERRDLIALPGPADALHLRAAGEEPLRVLLLGGEPLGEEIIMWWNFVGRTHEEVVAFRERYQREIGAADANPDAGVDPRAAEAGARYGAAPGEDEFEQFGPFAEHTPQALPAPKLPGGRFRPRGRIHRYMTAGTTSR